MIGDLPQLIQEIIYPHKNAVSIVNAQNTPHILLSNRTKNISRKPNIFGKMSGSDENYPSTRKFVNTRNHLQTL